MKRWVFMGCLVLASARVWASEPETLLLPSDSPLVTIRILFHSGSAHDPAGKEGLAALTASMLSRGGTVRKSYEEILQEQFPMATSVQSQVDKEMTVFYGTTHRDNLPGYYQILRSMLLEPGWREQDFRRLRDQAINDLTIRLRSNNEEELAKEFLYTQIYQNHPYEHPSLGVARSLRQMKRADLKDFYLKHYRSGNVVLGLAGGYPEAFPQLMRDDFRQLPAGRSQPAPLPPARPPDKLHIKIIQKNTRSVAISLGFPIDLNRGSPEWPALKVAQSYFGQHRSSKSHLYQRIREIRGMNYGDYAYIEYFPRGMFQIRPDPNLARRQQIFQIWIRPVEPQNSLFCLRIALYELHKLIEQGLSEEAFQSTRRFLSKYVNLLTQTENSRLGYALDSRFYGIDPFNAYLKRALSQLTVEEVNQTIRKHLQPRNLQVVMIAKDAETLKKHILAGTPSRPHYVSKPPPEILDEDSTIAQYKLEVGSVEIIPVGSIFEN